MTKITWNNDNTISIEPPKRTKKITGTRFGAVLGNNPWKTPFATWCEITRTYEEPFTDNVYTLAGKAIEPLQHEYMRKSYGMTNLVSPEDIYGKDYFSKTYGDFFPDIKKYGGMWDALLVDENEEPITVLEFKTSKRAEDWEEDIPDYYALQAALYAKLLDVDDVIMVASFLEDKDYDNPRNFVPEAANTIVKPFKVSERYPNFNAMLDYANYFWHEHVLTGISPEYDEKKDADILKELRTVSLSPDTDIKEVIKEAELLKQSIDNTQNKIKESEKKLKELQSVIKEYLANHMEEGKDRAIVNGKHYDWTLAKSVRTVIKYDEKQMKQDGCFDKYANLEEQETYRLTTKKIGD